MHPRTYHHTQKTGLCRPWAVLKSVERIDGQGKTPRLRRVAIDLKTVDVGQMGKGHLRKRKILWLEREAYC